MAAMVTKIFGDTFQTLESTVCRLVPHLGEVRIVVGQAVAVLHDGPI